MAPLITSLRHIVLIPVTALIRPIRRIILVRVGAIRPPKVIAVTRQIHLQVVHRHIPLQARLFTPENQLPLPSRRQV